MIAIHNLEIRGKVHLLANSKVFCTIYPRKKKWLLQLFMRRRGSLIKTIEVVTTIFLDNVVPHVLIKTNNMTLRSTGARAS